MPRPPRAWLLAGTAAGALVLPLVLPFTWSELHVSLTTVPSLIGLLDAERPLSVRSPEGVWTLGLAVAWFAAGIWRRDTRWWELGLVLLGCLLAILRMGNAWVSAELLAPPIARQLHQLKLPAWVAAGLTLAGVCTALVLWNFARPPTLPPAAVLALNAASESGEALSTLPWAPQVQAAAGSRYHVLGARAPWDVPDDTWQRYINVAIGRWDWEQQLTDLGVNLVVIDPGAWQVLGSQLRNAPQWQVTHDQDGVLIARRISA